MNKKAVALLSGGLDSTLAICIVKEQGVEIEAVNFQTMFGCCRDDAMGVAHKLGVRYTTVKVEDDYLDLVKNPRHGYGKGMNPCVDCRGYMFQLGKNFMEKTGASFLISGEVLGQRPMSQKRKDFDVIEKDTGLQGLILRPLSAKCLPLTKPEKEGIVDREKLYGIVGRSRSKLLELAEKYGIEDPPHPSSGCSLTSPEFSKKVKDVFDHRPDFERWEFEVLRMGRHFRLTDAAKVIVARNSNESDYLEALHPAKTALLKCENFGGPSALIQGSPTDEGIKIASSLMLRYAQKPLPEEPRIRVLSDGLYQNFVTKEIAEEPLVNSLRIV